MFIKKILLIVLVFALSSHGKAQAEDTLKAGSPKSWGLGIKFNTGAFNYGESLTLFYQKDRNQLELDLFSRFDFSGFRLSFFYYPNDWKKRLDLRVETGLVLNFYQSDYFRYALTPFAGYGLRFMIFRHFYLTHSGNVGLRYANYPNYFEESARWNSVVDLNIGLMFNLGSLRWRKK